MKCLIPLLLVSSACAADIESVSISPNVMIARGSGFTGIQQATLANKPIKFYPVSDKTVMLVCDCYHWPVGAHRLRLFKPLRKLQIDVTITGLETDDVTNIIPADPYETVPLPAVR